jgi:cell division GTPase FtsZ
MKKNLLLDGLDDPNASSYWKVTAIGLGDAAAQAVEYLKTQNFPSVHGFAFPSLPEDGIVLTTELKNRIELSDIIIITVGNEEALPVTGNLAEISSELGITSIGLVCLPCGKQRDNLEEVKLRYRGLACLDALIPVWEKQPAELRDDDISSHTASASKLRDVLYDLVEISTLRDCLSIDYADINKLLRYKGNCAYGMGFAQGAQAGQNALDAALEDVRLLPGAQLICLAVLVYVRAGKNITMSQFDAILSRFQERVDRDTAIAVGLSLVETMQGQIACSLLVTGMPSR